LIAAHTPLLHRGAQIITKNNRISPTPISYKPGTFLLPLLVYQLQPPAITATPEAPRMAAARLKELGTLT
jgi:hypothetical protein